MVTYPSSVLSVHSSSVCGENHAVWNLKCKENIFQSEITKLMTRTKIQRRDATEIVRSCYPDRTRSYAAWYPHNQEVFFIQQTVNLGNTFLVMKPLMERMRWKLSRSKRTLEDPTLQPGRSDISTGGHGCSRGRTEVVCHSPKSGRIFAASINLH